MYWHLSRNRIILSFLRRLPPGRVLDAGCGRAFLWITWFAPALTALVWSRETRQYRNTFASDLRQASSDLPADFRAAVGAIVLGDVIEHLPTRLHS